MISHKQKSKITFHYLIKPFFFPNRVLVKKIISQIFTKERKKLISLSYIFCSDEYLHDLNRKFLFHDELTDIITFNLSSEETAITGEVYISMDRVRDNATVYKTLIFNELIRVIFHGALHLCNFNDNSKEEKIAMHKMEEFYLTAFKNTLP